MRWRAGVWLRVALVVGMSLGLVVAGCGKVGDSVTIKAISPPPGSVLDAPTQFTVTLEYVLQSNEKDYAPGTFQIDWNLAENGGRGGVTVGNVAGPLDEALSGTVTLSFQLPFD
jgi:hypothetical protein